MCASIRASGTSEGCEQVPGTVATRSGSRERRRLWSTLWRRKTAVLGFVIVGCYVVVALFAPTLVPHDPNHQDLTRRLAPPIGLGLANADGAYPLGNDNLGRDILSRLISGTRISLMVGTSTVIGAALFGSLVGALAGYLRGWFDTGDMRVVSRHILPNTLSTILVIATLQLGTVVITEASLSFLGISVESSIPTWGGMLSDGREFMRGAWWLATFPGIAISILVLGANLLGDGLRDALDPHVT